MIHSTKKENVVILFGMKTDKVSRFEAEVTSELFWMYAV